MNWLKKLLGSKDASQVQYKEELGEEHAVIQFDPTIESISKLSNKAKTTFMFRLVAVLPPTVLKSTFFYVKKRLDAQDTNVG